MESRRDDPLPLDNHVPPPVDRPARRRNRWVVTLALAVAMLPVIAFLGLLAWAMAWMATR